MGRFDLLTQREKQADTPPPLPRNEDTLVSENPFASKPVKKQTDTEGNQQASERVNQQTTKEANKQTSQPANQQGGKPVNVQTSKPASVHTGLPANQQASKVLKKFSSYLQEGSLKQLKRIAFETDRKDYEVLQEAVDEYLQKK